MVQKRNDPQDQLFVFFPEDPKVGVKPIRKYTFLKKKIKKKNNNKLFSRHVVINESVCVEMTKNQVKRAILVVQEHVTSFARSVKSFFYLFKIKIVFIFLALHCAGAESNAIQIHTRSFP